MVLDVTIKEKNQKATCFNQILCCHSSHPKVGFTQCCLLYSDRVKYKEAGRNSTLDEIRRIKINGINNKSLKYKQNENNRSKSKIFFFVVMIQGSIIKQFEQMPRSLKQLKMCPSANVWFAESC